MDRTRPPEKARKNGSIDEELVRGYSWLVNSVARSIRKRLPPSVELADLVGYGFLGLLDAASRYDPERGIGFEDYARKRIWGAILDGLRSEKRLPRSLLAKMREVHHAIESLSSQLQRMPGEDEVASHLGLDTSRYRRIMQDIDSAQVISLEDLVGRRDQDDGLDILESLRDESAPDPLEEAERQESTLSLYRAIESLPEREKVVLVLYYFDELSMKEIGEVMEISESRVSQLHSSALRSLRRLLAGTEIGKRTA
jgi:RNA polymerase sigma factor for flagellar operon FliA